MIEAAVPDARFSLLCSKARFVISETRDSNRLDCQKGLKTRIEPQRLVATVSNRNALEIELARCTRLVF